MPTESWQRRVPKGGSGHEILEKHEENRRSSISSIITSIKILRLCFTLVHTEHGCTASLGDLLCVQEYFSGMLSYPKERDIAPQPLESRERWEYHPKERQTELVI
jgi:hypothetical protein